MDGHHAIHERPRQDTHKQLSEEMNVPKELMDRLFLTAGGRGTIGMGGGGSDNELTNWDGTKKRNGWGV